MKKKRQAWTKEQIDLLEKLINNYKDSKIDWQAIQNNDPEIYDILSMDGKRALTAIKSKAVVVKERLNSKPLKAEENISLKFCPCCGTNLEAINAALSLNI